MGHSEERSGCAEEAAGGPQPHLGFFPHSPLELCSLSHSPPRPPSTLLLARLKSGGTGVLGIGRCIWEPKDDLFSACKR